MMALGTDIMATGGKLQSSQSSISDGTNTTKLFAQMHYYVAPVWKMLDMFSDLPCLEDDGFDVALMTEVMPTWQSGTLGAIKIGRAHVGHPVTTAHIACSLPLDKNKKSKK